MVELITPEIVISVGEIERVKPYLEHEAALRGLPLSHLVKGFSLRLGAGSSLVVWLPLHL